MKGERTRIDTTEAARLLERESEAVAALAAKLDDTFERVVEAILACTELASLRYD